MADERERLNTSPAARTNVTAAHLKRDAFLYVRQSTLHQVLQNTESTQRQYALQQRAVALGWPIERVHVIECDLGHSGASAVDREGFQQLVTEVSLGRAGVVLGLEVSRLARNSADWQRLLELCALTETLILDEDGLYDCNDFNDRLLLGMKGTLSEAELHFLRARLRGGILSKARRGELASPLPVGFVYVEDPTPVGMKPGTSGSIPTSRCNKLCTYSLPPSGERAPPMRRSSTFGVRACSFRAACGAGYGKESWSGERWACRGCCLCCIIPAMRGRSALVAVAPGSGPTADHGPNPCPARIGSC
jgi:DNA invertase Pin-like site-specific DNA recombinase